jgi:Tubulin like
MACYVIGIGGTGAKCIEALIHLCAAGLMPDIRNAQGQVVGKEDLYVAFVDSDVSNGSLDRARVTLTQYNACKVNKFGATDLFKTKLYVGKKDGKTYDTWSPFAEDDTTQPQLADFFDYESLVSNSKSPALRTVGQLMDVLYSHEEKTTTLERGFRGHPSIGAAVLSSSLNFNDSEPWETLKNRIRQDVAGEGARIILIGSVFGGTGAAGLPTIARLISNEFNLPRVSNTQLGGVLVLPYFSFDPPREDGMRADSENFLLSTQAALKYYHQQAIAGKKMGLDVFQTMYILGEAQLSPVAVPSLGSTTQRNEQHVLELYAALACLDFFDRSRTPAGYNMIARRSQAEIGWPDLPYAEPDLLRKKIGQLARYAFAYLSSYFPTLINLKKSYCAPWYIDFFERRNLLVEEHKTTLEDMRDYCESFLLWLAHITTSAKGIEVSLIKENAFSEVVNDTDDGKPRRQLKQTFALREFDNLVLPESKKKSPNGLHHLWENMCITSIRDKDADALGKFFHALYAQCAIK